MSQKLVSQLDSQGYFIGTTPADESPREPGVYLIPGGAIDQPAPRVPENHRAKWNGSDWEFELIVIAPPDTPVEDTSAAPVVDETPPEITVEGLRAAVEKAVADKKKYCAVQAQSLLRSTDWAVLPDVNLINRDEFIGYRAMVREFIFNPVAEPSWPVQPKPRWNR